MSKVVEIARDFADGTSEPWRGSPVASHWRAYVSDMLNERERRPETPVPVAVNLRMANGQLVTIRPKRRGTNQDQERGR